MFSLPRTATLMASALAAAASLAGPASALSCVPWGPADGYLEASKSDKSYVVVDGILRFDASALPKAPSDDPNNTPPRTAIPASLSGKLLTEGGFQREVELPVTLEILCLGPWCASAEDGLRYVAFLEQRGDELVLEENPCGGFGFSNEDGQAARDVLACHAGRACTPWRDR
ncbi:hypothetical protein [Phaeobacter italicus]|uniref:hypothetical protein n=1 Tax=Phaeobacter italicus TaxID=481446 RepID=UPI002432B8E1|nr:hypothetical protein [Phaeobacter italicus]MCI5100450.1 hypothetical protein [Phaeobacter italicus]